MGARNQYASINFLGGCLKIYRKFLHLIYAISTMLFLVTRKVCRVPISSWSLNKFLNFPWCAIAVARVTRISRPYVRGNDRRFTDSARTSSWYRVKPKCNFSLSSVRWIYNVKTIVAHYVGMFFGEERETNYCWGIRKNVWDSGRYRTFEAW